MTDLTSVAIPKPRDWQAFERHCRLLFELSFKDPAVQNNGRSGQRQQGVDIYGRRDAGKGRLVGIQCKGKDADYGGEVTETELRSEVEKTKKFMPSIDELLLVTTAPNDAKIQRTARLLENELRVAGRNLVIQVWGWERVQQEINRFPEAIKAFHPDATIFTDKILNTAEEIKRLVAEGTASAATGFAGIEQQLAQVLTRLPSHISADASGATDALDKELHDQIDGYRDLLRSDKPRTALDLLTRLKDRLGANASERVRYRLLSNIGAAHYNLANYDTASDFLLEAAPLNPDDVGSLANKTAALLMKGHKEDAHAVVIGALAKYPDSQELALQRLQALGYGETVEIVWQSLSAKAKGAAIVFGFRIGVLREEGDANWRLLVEEGCRLYPDDVGLQVFRAESVIDRLLKNDPGAVGFVTKDVPTQSELREAAEFLEKTWRDSKGRETPSKPVCGHNAALAFNILRETQRAAALLDDIMAAGYDAEETKQLRVAVYRRQGKDAEAIRLSDTLADTPMHRVMRADLRIDTAPAEAREILADRGSFTGRQDILGRGLAIVESFIKEKDFGAALAEASQLEAALPDHPQGPLAHFRVKNARGDEDIHADLDRALALVGEDTDFPTRFLVAEVLGSVERFDEVVDILYQKTSHRFDSPALRALVAAAANADRRVTLKKIFNDLPPEVANQPFYAKAKIALAIHAGDIPAAETDIRAFLQNDPSNLELHIQLLHALFRRNKMEELKEATAIPATQFKGRPFDFIKLAHFKDGFGDWQEAHALAYATLLANPNSQSVSMGYISIFLRPGHSRELSVVAPKVQNDTAVGLKDEEGSTTVYIIEPNSALRPSANYLASDHLVAQLLKGKSVGDTVEMPVGTTASIAWIKPKALHALHDLMDNFNNRFPEAKGLEHVKIDTSKEGGFEPIFERVRDRHDATEQVANLYETGVMSLSLVGRSLGCDPIEAMVGLASTGYAIRVCDGNHLERARAFAAIDANGAQGCVVDAATLHVIRRLKIEGAVAAVCGPIHIVDETALLIQRKIQELQERIDEPDMSLAYREGQYYRTEVLPDQKKEALMVLEADRQWLADHATIIPAEGSKDPSPSWRALIERFGSDFLDEIRAAEGAGLLLLSEGHVLRALGQLDYIVPGTWLQPVLMRALKQKAISEEDYRDAVVAMIDSKFQFIAISSDILLSSLSGVNGHTLPIAFEKLASKIGGKTADMQSHLSVAYGTAVLVWTDRNLTETVKQAVVGLLLERLIEDRTIVEVRAIIEGWVELERERARGGTMLPYIADWLRGHFIEFK